jgi:hypothetical protein
MHDLKYTYARESCFFSKVMTFNPSYNGMSICVVKQKYLIQGVQARAMEKLVTVNFLSLCAKPTGMTLGWILYKTESLILAQMEYNFFSLFH